VRRGTVVLAVVIAALAAWYLWPSDERAIRKRLESLAQAASVPPGEADLARLARAQRFRTVLRADVHVAFERAEWPPIDGREAVAALVARPWSGAAGGLDVQLQDVSVSLSSDRTSADVRAIVRVVSRDHAQGADVIDGRMISATFSKTDGEWRVASARILQTDDAVR
jgi:hypothetical protein